LIINSKFIFLHANHLNCFLTKNLAVLIVNQLNNFCELTNLQNKARNATINHSLKSI